jgi:hypothetical protein
LPPVFAIAPFDDVWRAPPPEDPPRDAAVERLREAVDRPFEDRVLLRPEFERVPPELERVRRDEPLLLDDLFVLELPLEELLLEDRVCCAIFLSPLSCWASVPGAPFQFGAAGVPSITRSERI